MTGTSVRKKVSQMQNQYDLNFDTASQVIEQMELPTDLDLVVDYDKIKAGITQRHVNELEQKTALRPVI
jgi:hypothetical protein